MNRRFLDEIMVKRLSFFSGLTASIVILLVSFLVMGRASASPALVQTASIQPAQLGAASGGSSVIHYQGRLLDPSTGQAKPDGAYIMNFSLYDVETAGSPLWSETKNIGVNRGLFSTLLGDTTFFPADLFNGQALYLGITVGSDPETTPRQRIASVAYAIFASTSAWADTLDGQDSTAFAPAAHTHTGNDIVDGSLKTVDLADGAVSTAKISPAGASDGQLLGFNDAGVAWMTPSRTGLLKTTVFGVNCKVGPSFGTVFTKLVDVGAFTKLDGGSTIEITFNGRLAVGSLTSSNGAIFELRVDDTPTTNVWARAAVKSSEVGIDGVQSSITGIFTGVGAGNHILSMWVQAVNSGGSGTSPYIDPGCWSSASFVIKELK